MSVSQFSRRVPREPGDVPITGQYVDMMRIVVVGRWNMNDITVANPDLSFCVFDRYCARSLRMMMS